MSSPSVEEAYESGRRRAYLVMAFLFINLFVQVIVMASTFIHIDLLYKVMEETVTVTRAERQASAAREAVMRVVQLVAFLAAGAVFLAWLHRVYKNLKPLGAEPRYAPGLAVGAFVIPLVNLFLPFQIVQEIWRASDPETVAAGGAKGLNMVVEESSKSLLVVVWWGLWLLTIVNLVIAYRWHLTWEILNEEIITSWLIMAMSLLLVVSSLVSLLLVKKVTDRQDEKKRRLAELAAPPEDIHAPEPG